MHARTAHTSFGRRGTRRARVVCALVIVMLAQLVAASSAHAVISGFSVSPLLKDIDLSPGARTTFKIRVTNKFGTSMKFAVTKEDIKGSSTDAGASPIFLGGEVDSPISLYDWMTVSPSSFTLAANATKVVSVAVTAPSDATGGHYGSIIVSSATASVSSDVKAQSRVATVVMVNSGGNAPPSLIIDDVTETEDGVTIIEYINESDTAISPEGDVTYTDPITGDELAGGSAECDEIVLPGARGKCVISHGELTGGLSPFANGEATLIVDGQEFTAPLPRTWNGGWAWLLPLLGVGLLVGWFVRVRRHGKDDESGGDDDDGSTLARAVV